MEKCRWQEVKELSKNSTDDLNFGSDSSVSIEEESYIWVHFNKYKDDKSITWAKY